MAELTTETEVDEADEARDVGDAGDVDEVEEGHTTSPPRTGGRLVAFVVALAVVFGLVAAVMTASYVRLRSDRDAANDEHTKILTTAAQVAQALTTMEATGDGSAQLSVLQSLATAPLIDQYRGALPSTQKLLVALGVTSEHGQIPPQNGVYLGDVDNAQAQVLVVVDLVVVGQVVKTVPNQYLRLHLVKLDGTWKVDNVENLNVALAASGGNGAAPAASTSTTVPLVPSTSSSG